MKKIHAAILSIFSLCLVACVPLNMPLPSGASGPSVSKLPYSGTFYYQLDPGKTPRDVYFVFTNTSTIDDASKYPTVNGSEHIVIDGEEIPAPIPQPLFSYNSEPQTAMEKIEAWRPNAAPSAPGFSPYISTRDASTGDIVGGASDDFYAENFSNGNPDRVVNATCRYHETLTFADGRQRALSIWVENDRWNSTGADQITQEMVDDMAIRFLAYPAENIKDIYHSDTAILGEPWGSLGSSNLIDWDASNTITILLANLNASYAGSGGIVGYFWSKDNFKTAYSSYSNQRIMFYMDATWYSRLKPELSETAWLPTTYWSKILYSALAHEFQHMIQFYQKQVVIGSNYSATWLNEMCSLVMEDLVSESVNLEGPRGVDFSIYANGSAGAAHNTNGRMWEFNRYSYGDYYTWNSNGNYGIAYAFGAYLARNFGGAEFLHRVVNSPETGNKAVTDAVAAYTGKNRSFADLLSDWAVSVLVSDRTDAPAGYRYNIGSWFPGTTSSAVTTGQSFRLGSINAFNYDVSGVPGPYCFAPGTASVNVFGPSSNVYFLAAKAQSSHRNWKITIPKNVTMSVVLK